MTLLELLQLLRQHLKIVVVLPIVFSLLVGAYAYIIMPDEYTASTSVYVLAKADQQDNAMTLSTSLSAGQMLTTDVATLIKSDRVAGDVAKANGLKDLSDYELDVSNSTTNRVITISVTGGDPVLAASIANDVATDVSAVAQEVMDVQSVNAIDRAAVPDRPSGPRRAMYVALAFLAGLFCAVAAVVALDALNTRVRDSADAEGLLGIPVVGQFPSVKEAR